MTIPPMKPDWTPEQEAISEINMQIAEAMQSVRASFPMTIEFKDGSTQVVQTLEEVPKGVPFRVLPTDEWVMVGTLDAED